jgi:radical SAM superfamily enzyme YgiQ (UPF0313 family)
MSEAKTDYHFEVGVYRPPSEGGSDSLLVRFTRNCPWNRCTFCAMYKHEKFEVRTPVEIKRDIDAVAAICSKLREFSGAPGRVTRTAAVELLSRIPALNRHHGFPMVFNWLQSGGRTAFLQDANSLIMKTEHLADALGYLRRTFPSIERVTSYARSKTIARKNPGDLAAIREAGLDRLHVGLETGDDGLLKKINKGVTAEGHIRGGRKAVEAGFQLSEYWMPGLGGKAMWEAHARNTARVLNAINPHYIRSRPVFPAPGTPLHQQLANGAFQLLDPHEQLVELKVMLQQLDVTSRVCFDHAANYWRNPAGGLLFSHGYEGYQFPDQKAAVLALVERGLSVRSRRPAFFRL